MTETVLAPLEPSATPLDSGKACFGRPCETIEGIIGDSTAIQEILSAIPKVAAADAPVYVGGESGTGKELVARAIHEHSSRSKAAFQAINCAALPASLSHSELFGYEKGGFTGADKRKIGRIEAANGGTIFLDEIGDLSLDLQAILLRFLQEGTIDRVGGVAPIEVDVRVVAATHVDLEHAVSEGRFRGDLYYRLNVLHLELPPLRERVGDIELLGDFYRRRFAAEQGKRVEGFSELALRRMNDHSWPGNIRELINRVRRAVVMCDGPLLTPGDLELDRRRNARALTTLAEARAEADKRAILSCLRHCRNNVAATARKLDVSRVTLYKLMGKYGLAPDTGSRAGRQEP